MTQFQENQMTHMPLVELLTGKSTPKDVQDSVVLTLEARTSNAAHAAGLKLREEIQAKGLDGITIGSGAVPGFAYRTYVTLTYNNDKSDEPAYVDFFDHLREVLAESATLHKERASSNTPNRLVGVRSGNDVNYPSV